MKHALADIGDALMGRERPATPDLRGRLRVKGNPNEVGVPLRGSPHEVGLPLGDRGVQSPIPFPNLTPLDPNKLIDGRFKTKRNLRGIKGTLADAGDLLLPPKRGKALARGQERSRSTGRSLRSNTDPNLLPSSLRPEDRPLEYKKYHRKASH